MDLMLAQKVGDISSCPKIPGHLLMIPASSKSFGGQGGRQNDGAFKAPEMRLDLHAMLQSPNASSRSCLGPAHRHSSLILPVLQAYNAYLWLFPVAGCASIGDEKRIMQI